MSGVSRDQVYVVLRGLPNKSTVIADTVKEILTPIKLLYRCPVCMRRGHVVAHTVGERWECTICGSGGPLVLQPDEKVGQ